MTSSRGFTAPDRNLLEEDSIRLVSVGVDIGSSTSHLVFSRITLERRDNRYAVVLREVLRESAITFTPYAGGTTIDAAALHTFIEGEYREAGITRSDVDTGALILTGVALERDNARAIADMFAAETGKFVAVSAGDNLEATLALHRERPGEGASHPAARRRALRRRGRKAARQRAAGRSRLGTPERAANPQRRPSGPRPFRISVPRPKHYPTPSGVASPRVLGGLNLDGSCWSL